jgi:hypothetical protein
MRPERVDILLSRHRTLGRSHRSVVRLDELVPGTHVKYGVRYKNLIQTQSAQRQGMEKQKAVPVGESLFRRARRDLNPP